MKIKFLGTAAAEGFPAVFCNCEYCREARRLGGKNIRTRSQTLINDDLLIDLPADTYSHFLNNGIEGDKIQNLLITHSHQDHFYPHELKMRGGAYAHNMRVSKLNMFCGEGAYKKTESFLSDHALVSVHLLKEFEPLKIGNYTVTPLPARHHFGDNALFYIIQDTEKTFLYAHDTGFFYDEVFEYMKNNSFEFDLISLDCTNINIPINDTGTHMGLENISRLIKRLQEIGAVTNDTIKVLNHFSHNGEPIQHKLENMVSKDGFIVAYDGLNISV